VSQSSDSESIELVLNLDDDEQPEALQRRAAKKLRVPADELGPIEVLKRSIDARHGKVRFR
jgi:uncharacterized FAD-dependent dehydrogenase